jgi:predicted permease
MNSPRAKLRALTARVLGLFHAGNAETDFSNELESHIAFHVEDGIRAGLSPVEARRRALLQLGCAEQTRQAYRERATLPWLETLLYDLRYALRGLRRNPIFAVTVIVTLALAIGATTAVFSVVDRVLFRSLPFAHDERLVSVGLTAPIIPQEFMLGGSYYDWRDNQKPFAAFTSEAGATPCDLTEHNPAHLDCASVEASFLPTLGVSPLLGRNFLPEEDRPNGPKVALISYGLWLSHYNRDPNILSRQIDIDGRQVRVVGVLPRDFEMPALEQADVVMPQALDEAEQRKADPGRVLYAFARLKPGITIPQAIEQLQPVFNYSLSLAPPRFRSEVHLRVRSLRDLQMHDVRLVAWVLFAAVIAVLLIACANVASLLLTRAVVRERELAVRSALGATGGRLMRQSIVESLLLSFCGAAAGCAVAEALLRIFIAIAPSSLPSLRNAQLDLRIIGFAVLLALVTAILFGVAPALQRPRSIALSARSPSSVARAGLRRILVVAQMAGSVILLAGAALLVRSFINLQSQPLGIQSRGVLAASISLNRYRYTTPQAQMQFFLQAESALRRLPGISEVGIGDTAPPGGFQRDQIYSVISVAGQPPLTGGTGGMVVWRWVTPEYFKALDIPVLRGQSFTEQQRTSSEHVIILSSLLASRLFPGKDPIGQHIRPTPADPWYTVQGVAANVKNGSLDGQDQPEFYRLRRNVAEDWQQAPSAVLVAKTGVAPQTLAPWVRSQIAAIDPTIPVDLETLDERVGKLADRPRFQTALLSFFACTALAMAVIGLYGVLAFVAKQRTQEIGVRIALGATRANILRLIAGDGVRLIVLGSVLGLAGASVLTRLLKTLLFHVAPYDPASFIGVMLFMAVVALAATMIPARSAMKTDPIEALRNE